MLALVALALLVPSRADDASAKEWTWLVGTWNTVSFEVEGKKEADTELTRTRTLSIEKEAYTLKVEGLTIRGKLQIDATKSPKHITFVPSSGKYASKALPAIYELKGDRLRICAVAPDQARPTEFTGRAGSKQTLFTYERKK